jgi:hypothetical protein
MNIVIYQSYLFFSFSDSENAMSCTTNKPALIVSQYRNPPTSNRRGLQQAKRRRPFAQPHELVPSANVTESTEQHHFSNLSTTTLLRAAAAPRVGHL